MIIVIDGIDGTGKATQSSLLCEKLKRAGFETKVQAFPNYSSPSHTLVKWYLNGTLGDVDAKQASVFYAYDRFETMKQYEDFLKAGGVLIIDRYYQSNIVHQGSKIADENKWNEFADWIVDLEINKINLPKEDAVFYLLVNPEDSEKLRANRNNNFKSGDKKDIHEQDPEHMKNAFISANRGAKKFGWHVIDCYNHNNASLRTIEDISNEIFEKVMKMLKK